MRAPRGKQRAGLGRSQGHHEKSFGLFSEQSREALKERVYLKLNNLTAGHVWRCGGQKRGGETGEGRGCNLGKGLL
jgi:hypothetical protein